MPRRYYPLSSRGGLALAVIVFLTIGLAIGGCTTAAAPSFFVAAKQPQDLTSLRGTYRLETSPAGARSNHALTADAIRRVRAGLEAEGFVPAAPGIQADYVVEVTAYLEKRLISARWVEVVPGSGIFPSSPSSGTPQGEPRFPRYSPGDPRSIDATTGKPVATGLPDPREQTSTYSPPPSASVSSQPRPGYTETTSSYEKRLDLVIRENPAIVHASMPRVISAITVVNHGGTPAIDEAVPVLIAVAFDTLGKGRSMNTVVTARAANGRFVVDG